ncbi:hypothetical protein MTR_4g054170 [Medicago truncatula]|uniref:OTU domain-containing protein n=1 Tax=Medicago truncatula TaxID=3880 RepID=G7JJP0_MEDTR|nr:hypothetical protein MTR_4g054170 [Medicago truncatula]
MMSPHPRKIPTKGAKKKLKSIQKITSTSHNRSSWETIDSKFRDSQSSPKKSSQPKRKGARLVISPRSSIPMPTLKIVDVRGDVNCGFKAIVESIGLTEESHVIVQIALIREVKEHMNHYMPIYGGEDRYNYILNGLHLPKNGSGFELPDN